jgi:hypothetical protein
LKGLKLTTFKENLFRVGSRGNQKPSGTITGIRKKLGKSLEVIHLYYSENFDFKKKYYDLRWEWLSGFSFDEICKLRYSTIVSMHQSVDDVFRNKVQYEIVHKITNSMWRWGMGRGTWNEVVDAYDNIRNFHFHDDPNFEIRLDYTTGYNEYGYAKFSRTYIDGTFAFLVYYKGTHVMTIGFSILEGRRILIQQVQSTKRSGNRYLFKLPSNRLEFVLELFQKNFSGYKLWVIDGHSLVEKSLRDYRGALEREEEFLRTHNEDSFWTKKFLEEKKEDCEQLRRRIAHLEADRERLAAFYKNTGQYQLKLEPKEINRLRHYPIAA